MKNKNLYLVLAGFILAIIIVVIWGIKSAPTIEAPIVEVTKGEVIESDMLYYCNTVTNFCKNMEKYFVEKGIEEKIFFTKRDIIKNPEYLRELNLHAEGCGLEGNVGTPFLFAEGKCFIGESEVKNYFEKKLSQ